MLDGFFWGECMEYTQEELYAYKPFLPSASILNADTLRWYSNHCTIARSRIETPSNGREGVSTMIIMRGYRALRMAGRALVLIPS